MQHGIAIFLTFTFSTLFAVDSPKESVTPTESTSSQEIQFDAESFQKNISLKKGMIETYKQARKANGIPKPKMKPNRVSNNKATPTNEKVSPKENSNEIATKKSFKESINDVTKKDKKVKKEAYLEKRELAKQKRDKLMAKAKANRESIIKMKQYHSLHSNVSNSRTEIILSGIVNDGETGLPIEGAAVKAAWSTEESISDTTDENGYYEIELDETNLEDVIITAHKRVWSSIWNYYELHYYYRNYLPIDGGTTDIELFYVNLNDTPTANSWLEVNVVDDNENDGNPISVANVNFNHEDIFYSESVTNYEGKAFCVIEPESPPNFDTCFVTANKEGYEEGTGTSIGGLYAWYNSHGDNINIICAQNDEMPTYGNIFGTVMDDSENSIPHANLHIWNNNGDGQDFHFEADENGNFSEDVEPGEYHVEAYPEGYISQWMVVVVNEGDSIEVLFNLEEENTNDGPFVEGIVRDFNGNPIANAGVYADNGYTGYSTETNEEGYYHLDLDSIGYHFMSVWGDPYWEDVTHVDVDEDGTQHDFILGHIEETALIMVMEAVDTVNWEPVSYPYYECPDSPQGMSIGNEIGEDMITVEAPIEFAEVFGWHPEFGEGYGNTEESWTEEIEPYNEYDMVVFFGGEAGGGETGTFSGMLLDEDDRPVDGLVEFSSPDHEDEFVANAEGGEFSIDLPAGAWSANAHDGGAGEYWSDRYDGVLNIEPETEQSHDFYLYSRSLYGYLDIRAWAYDENGEPHPLPYSYIMIEGDSESYDMELDIWSQADQAVLPGEYTVSIESEFGYEEMMVDAPADSQVMVEFYFEMENNEHGFIEGHIFDQDDNPIQDAVVEVWNEEIAFVIETDEYGYFGMEIMAGNYELEAHADFYSSEYDNVEVYPEETTYVEFYLEWENDMTMVSGYVSDNEGNPISFALVNASYLYDEWESEGSFTDENVYYELHLEEGDYRITAGAEGFWVDAYDSVYVGNDSLWLDFSLSSVEQFDGGWTGNVNLVGNHEPEMIFLGIMSEDYQVLRILDEPGFQEVPLVNGTYHLFAGADGYQDVFMPYGIQVENNEVNFNISLIEEGLVLPPQINWAGDVPNDQGRQMRLVWNPGIPGDWGYFEFYSIWRQVDEAPMPLWDFIDVVPWHGMEPYSAVVPTLGDSTDMGIYYSTFRVTAHTDDPNVFYDSEPVTGYSIDNLHPGAPGGVQAFNQDDGILLTWDSPVDEDFGYHHVYRLDLDSEEPAIDFTTVDTFFVDNVTDGNFEYWITAVDLNGNESDASNAVTVTLDIDDGFAIPTEFALKQNYPNPFNPSTQIQYSLPTEGFVSVSIYDLMGRHVRSLVNEQVSAGYHSTLWNATNDRGEPVSAGVYIYTITAGQSTGSGTGFRDMKKMILLK